MYDYSMLMVAASSLTSPSDGNGNSNDDDAANTTVSSDPKLGVTLVLIGCLAQVCSHIHTYIHTYI